MRPLVPTVLGMLAIIVPVGIWGRRPDPPRPVRAEPEAVAPASVYQAVCLQCHGSEGMGNLGLGTPSIGGQPTWNLEAQLASFRAGRRGEPEEDEQGHQMRGVAITLSDEQVDQVIEEIAAFPRHPTQVTLEGGDPTRGKWLFEDNCMECHRFNGAGERFFSSSPLTGFQDWYLLRQIENFRSGRRGYRPDDENGAKMRHITSYLKDGDALDITAYIAELAERFPPSECWR